MSVLGFTTTAAGAAPLQGGIPACLELPTMTASEDCPSIEVLLTGAADAESLTFKVENRSGEAWNGSPIGMELVADGLTASEPEGSVEGGPADSQWITRGGILVVRCTFPEPVQALPPDAETSCRLPRLGLGDGTYTAWITGAIGGQLVGASLGSVSTADGVVPVARPVSLEFDLTGDEIDIKKAEEPAPPVDAGEAAEPSDEASSSGGAATWMLAGIVVLALLVAAGLVLWRRRSGGSNPA